MLFNFTPWIRRNRVKVISGLCVGFLALTGCQSSPDKSVTTEYRMFENQPRDNDVPEVDLDEDALTNLDDHYFRYLGVHGSTDFYMARTDHDGTSAQALCFIAVDNDADGAETNCAGPDDLENMVLQLDTAALGSADEAFLVPDEAELELPEGWSQIRRNVVVITDPEAAAQEAEGTLPDLTGGWENFTIERDAG